MTTIAVVATGAWFQSISAAATGSGTPPMRSPTRALSRAYRCSTASPVADRGSADGADDPPKRARRSEPASRNPWTMQPRAAARAFAAGHALPAHERTPDTRTARSRTTSITCFSYRGAQIRNRRCSNPDHRHGSNWRSSPSARARGLAAATIAGRLDVADRRVRRAVGCHPKARDVADSRTPRC